MAFLGTHLVVYDAGTRGVVFALLISLVGMVFSLWLLVWIFRFDEGTQAMQTIADAICEGAEGYFASQYQTIKKVGTILEH